MQFDPETILSVLGGKDAVAKMNSEERAEALEMLRAKELAKRVLRPRSVSQIEEEISARPFRRGVGTLYCVGATTPFGVRQADEGLFVQRLPKMPEQPGLIDYFKLRFFPAPRPPRWYRARITRHKVHPAALPRLPGDRTAF